MASEQKKRAVKPSIFGPSITTSIVLCMYIPKSLVFLENCYSVILGFSKKWKRSKDQPGSKKIWCACLSLMSQAMSIYNKYFVNKHIY
jgi:hypothetical protein